MGKSTNGPDWTDLLLYLTHLQESQRASVSVVLTCDGSGAGSRWRMLGLMSPCQGVDAWEARGVGATRLWPNSTNGTFEGCLFALLADLDHLWEQTQRVKEE